jgi:ABC-type sulfate/molybdate transport systems ATPase subunit
MVHARIRAWAGVSVLSVSGLVTQAGSFQLGPLGLAVSPGRVLVVLGPSGAGKSMLLDTIAGFRAPRSGQVHLGDRDITALPAEQRRIGMVFQDAALFPHLSVRDNIGFAPRLHGLHRAQVVTDLLDRFGIPHLAARAPRSLSGGERQRVALARALAAQPAALLLDEPLSALDQPTREDLREVLRETLRELDVPAIHVTHDRDEALRLADDLAILAAGTLRQSGPATHLSRHPADTVTARLLGWLELGPTRHNSTGLHVGELPINPATTRKLTGTVYYRPEEVRIGPPHHSWTVGLRVRTRIRDIVPTLPLARVRLHTNPPITAMMLHRDLDQLPTPPSDTAVEVTLPDDAIRVIQTDSTAAPARRASQRQVR